MSTAAAEQTPPNTTLAIAAQAPLTPAMLRPIAKPEQVIEAHKEAVAMINECLEDGRDYGTIPGTNDKKNLLKPGAERLVGAYGLRPDFEIMEQEVDHNFAIRDVLPKWVKKDKKPDNWEELKAKGLGRNKKVLDFKTKKENWQWQEKEEEVVTSQGLYRYVIKCHLYEPHGREVGQGVGSCSSLESKYIRSPRDAENTVVKIAKKRSLVDAVLTTLGLSDRFTQDVEDIHDNNTARGGQDAEHQAANGNAETLNYLTLERAITKEEADAADAYIKECGFDKTTYAALKDAAAKIGLDPRFAILQGKKQNLKDPLAIIGLLEFDDSADKPIDAEFREDPPNPATPPVAAGSSPAPAGEVRDSGNGEGVGVDPKASGAPPTPTPSTTNDSPSLRSGEGVGGGANSDHGSPSTAYPSQPTANSEQPTEEDPFEKPDTPALELTADEDPVSAFYTACELIDWPTLATAPTECLVAYKQILGRTIKGATDLRPDDYRTLTIHARGVKAGTHPEPVVMKRWKTDHQKEVATK